MKFSNFLFIESRDPGQDATRIDEALEEARLADELGIEVLWLGEHHFDGICVYVDPVSFAAALATTVKRARIGFAVAQMSLHHPIRMAEQLALIDNLTKGRLIVGLGRGTAYNVYDYLGYGIDPEEAQARLIEAEEIMIKAWAAENLSYQGRFWNIRLPLLRPRPYTRPHPVLIRACSGEASMVEQARLGRPFMMNVQTNEVTRQRMDLYRRTLREAGFDEGHVRRAVDETWIWRNVFVADTDSEAERVGVKAFFEMTEQRRKMREWVAKTWGLAMPGKAPVPGEPGSAAARERPEHGLIFGSPASVAEKIAEIDRIGVGGLIMSFRLGPMPFETAAKSLTLFMTKVAPEFQKRKPKAR